MQANLTMNPKCKQKIAENVPFSFFLEFKNEIISQRTAALCLSELLEDENNQEIIMDDKNRAAFLSTIRRMTRR
jgi:hypothetical protein